MAGLAVQVSILRMTLTVAVTLPESIHSGGDAPAHDAGGGAVVAAGAIIDVAVALPGALGLGDAAGVTVAVGADAGGGQALAIFEVHPAVVMAWVRVVSHGLMAGRAVCSADVGLFVAGMGPAGGRLAMTGGAALRIDPEAALMRVAFGAVLGFVVRGCGAGAVITGGGVAGYTHAVRVVIKALPVKTHGSAPDGLLHEGRVVGLGVRVVTDGAGLGFVGLDRRMAVVTGGFGADRLGVQLMAGRATAGGGAVIAVGIETGSELRADLLLIAASGKEQNEEHNAGED